MTICSFRIIIIDGRGGGLVVSVLSWYSDDPSLNQAEVEF